MVTDSAPREYQFIAGDLSLDFVNTLGGTRPDQSVELLTSFDLWLQWAEQAGICTASIAAALRQRAKRDPTGALDALGRAKGMREDLFQILESGWTQRPPAPSAINGFNAALSEALSHTRLEVTDCKCDCAWDDCTSFDSLWWPVAKQAATLLTSSAIRRLRQCAGSTCGWLYLDTTKNHSRRWCVMSDCGNREKVRRHRDRLKLAIAVPSS